MEVRDEPAGDEESVSRVDEEIGVGAARRHPPAAPLSRRLQRAGRGGADHDHAPPGLDGGVDARRGVLADRVALGIDRVRLHLRCAHRLEGAVADVQRDGRALDARVVERSENRLGEMQPRRRRRDRPGLACEHGLVAIAIEVQVRPLDVGRQRNVPDRLDGVHHRAGVTRPETDDPPAEVALLEHLAVQRASSALEPHLPAGPHPLTRVHQRLPSLVVDARHEQHLDHSAAGLTLANQPCREHPGVVEHHQVAGRQEPGDVPNR